MPRTASAKAETCCPPITAGQLSEAEASELAVLFAALSDPVRLRLLSIVAGEGEVCSCNLEGPLGKSQPTVSHHLKILVDAGYLTRSKRGTWAYYRLVPGALDGVARLLVTV